MSQRFSVTRNAQMSSGLLRMTCESLDMSELFEFQSACVELIETGAPNLTIDALSVRVITSAFLGSVIKAVVDARKSAQHITVRVRPDVAKTIRQLVGDEIIDIEKADPEQSRED